MPSGAASRQASRIDLGRARSFRRATAAAAVTKLKERARPRSIRLACLLAASEGIAHLHGAHPDVPLYTCAIDRCLNDHGYILPGLGDAGDRIFGTK